MTADWRDHPDIQVVFHHAMASAICRVCGALLARPEAHIAYHDAQPVTAKTLALKDREGRG